MCRGLRSAMGEVCVQVPTFAPRPTAKVAAASCMIASLLDAPGEVYCISNRWASHTSVHTYVHTRILTYINAYIQTYIRYIRTCKVLKLSKQLFLSRRAEDQSPSRFSWSTLGLVPFSLKALTPLAARFKFKPFRIAWRFQARQNRSTFTLVLSCRKC